MTDQNLTGLIERVQRLTGADRVVDELILLATGWKLERAQGLGERATWIDPCGAKTAHRQGDGWFRPTASLDAAMTLVPDCHRAGVLHHALARIHQTGFPDSTFLHRLVCGITPSLTRKQSGQPIQVLALGAPIGSDVPKQRSAACSSSNDCRVDSSFPAPTETGGEHETKGSGDE